MNAFFRFIWALLYLNFAAYIIYFAADNFYRHSPHYYFSSIGINIFTVTYLIFYPLILLKITAFSVFSIIRQIRFIEKQPNSNFFNGFELMSISKKVASGLIDLFLITLVWFGACNLISVILPYCEGYLIPSTGIYNKYVYYLNILFDYSLFLFPLTYLGYYVVLETKYASTPGKMINDCGVIAINSKKPSFNQILIRTVFKLFPLNEVMYYYNHVSVNESISDTRTIQLNDKTYKRYSSIIKNL